MNESILLGWFMVCLLKPSLPSNSEKAAKLAHAKHQSFTIRRRCESFIKSVKREEIYANKYENLENLRANIGEFIEEYYNRKRLHSALGYRSPEEFEQQRKRESFVGCMRQRNAYDETHETTGGPAFVPLATIVAFICFSLLLLRNLFGPNTLRATRAWLRSGSIP